MPAISTAVLLAASVAAVGGSVQQGLESRQQQRRGLRAQESAQRTATSRAAAESRRSGREQRRLNRKRPNLSSLLGREQQSALRGPGATTLTGSAGVNQGRISLGRSSLLGVT